MKFKISKKFQTKVETSERVLNVAEAFGLGLDETEFVVFDNLEIEIKEQDVVYIHGQSGSGKSILLRELETELIKCGKSVSNIDSVVLEDKPLIDQIGDSMSDAINTLSKTGINDAYLAIRKPQELSDGQKYRFKLAKLIKEDTDVWIADEFGAVLDRITAKTVAYNLQKVARQHKKILIVATTHDDLEEELGANLKIEKTYQDRVEIKRNDSDNN